MTADPRSPRASDEAPAVSPGWLLVIGALRRLPQGALSRGFGWIADRWVPRPLRRAVLGGFARAVGMDLAEAELPLESYGSLNALFVRRLRPGARRWPGDPRALVSPVDGVLGATGTLEAGTLLQAKGLPYRAAELLGSEADAAPFFGGRFLTIYLSPRHYHRIHTPAPGMVSTARHVPGALLPVNAPAVASVEGLFARNERLLALMDTELGRLAVVAVGAYNVGRISAAFDPAWSGHDGGWITNRGTPPPPERRYPQGIPVAEGDELMAFHLGSTVVLLAEPGVRLEPALTAGMDVQVGTVLARSGS